MITIKLELKETSQPLEMVAINTYTKGPFYCVYDGILVKKFPVENIFRITEEYKSGPI